jgi:hypothetical protein
MKEIEKLKKMGLYVAEKGELGPYAKGYFVGKIKSDLEDKKLCSKVSANDGNEIEVVEDGHLYPKDGFWVFEVWECVPGPAEDDFRCKFDLLENAVNAAINFFFGEPTIINGWIFPLHRHPEIQADLVEPAIKNAVKINENNFGKIVDEYREIFWEEPSWETALRYKFLKILPLDESDVVLMLRRDLKESYVVSDKF